MIKSTIDKILTEELTEIWALLSNEEKRQIIDNFTIHKYKKNKIVYAEGDEPEFLWALIEGKVKKFKDGVGGRVQILRLINPGQYFGYRAHFAGERYVSSAATLEESVLGTIPMPLLFVLLLVFCIVSLTLPKAADGIAFFLKPDFSAMTPKTVVNALGQAFFSLSLAMGILVTYSSYYPADTKLTRTAVTVSLLDLGTAILMGLIIFPAVMTFGLADHNLAGSALVFITLPEIFAQMGGTLFWSTLFFLLLSVAAFTSTISLAEVSVAFMECHFRMSRKHAVVTVVTPLFLLSSICSLSVGPWSDFKIMGMTIFDFLDTMATNIMLPVGGILLCIYMGWVAPRSFFRNELTNNGTLTSHAFWLIAFIVKWVAPALIALVLIGQFI